MKRAAIERLLPNVFQRTLEPGTPLFAILDTMEALHQPSEAILEHIENIFNPYLSEDRFIPLLAGWVDLDRLFPPQLSGSNQSASVPVISTGLDSLRELVASATTLSKWRGTALGLKLCLETATADTGFELKENVATNGGSRPFHLCVLVPDRLHLHRALIERIVEQEKPAYVTVEICFIPET